MLDISHNNKSKKNVFHVIIYSKENGETPFRDYLLSLPSKMKTKVLRAIELLEEKGTELREPYSSALRNGLFELTSGFTKKNDKTPRKEIEKAERYRADWIRRKQR